jgi:lipopolysaccharide export system permease protein
MRRSYWISTRYVAREFVLSFLVAFLFFFFIFFVNQLLLLAEDILSKDVAFMDVVRLIVFSLPSIIALAVPFGALVGALMAIGRLSSDNEIIAFQASGIPLPRLFTPVAVLGVVLSLGSFVMNDYLLPLGTIKFGELYRELLYANPNLELEANAVTSYQESVIVSGDVAEGVINGIVILEEDERGNTRAIVARSARVEREENRGLITLQLDDVFSQTSDTTDRQRVEYDYFSSGKMLYNILFQDITVSVRSPGPREMSSVDVYEEIRGMRADLEERRQEQRAQVAEHAYSAWALYNEVAANRARLQDLERVHGEFVKERAERIRDRSLTIHRLEFHKKFSIPFACISFVVFAFPVGLVARRSGRAVGFGVGLLVAFGYWSMLIAGQSLGIQRADVSPVLAMWLPNLVVLVLGMVLLMIKVRR